MDASQTPSRPDPICPVCHQPVLPGTLRAFRDGADPLQPEILHQACWRARVHRETRGPPLSSAPARVPRILVVDDDAEFRQTLREILEAEAFDVEEAGTGQDALTACARGAFALAIVDLVMPAPEGFGLLHLLRRRHPALPVVLVTGTALRGSEEAIRMLAMEHGAHGLFRKPLDLPRFTRLVHQLISEAR